MRRGGECSSENVGMSNRNPDEISGDRKPKVSLAMKISQGLGDPKANPKGAVDGQPVNIPALPYLFLKETRNWKVRALLDLLSQEEFWFRPGQLI